MDKTIFLSNIIGKSIYNRSGDKIGRVADLVVTHLNSPIPTISGFLISRRFNKNIFVPISDFAHINKGKVQLDTDTLNFSPYQRVEQEIILYKEVVDKQIVDIEERQLTRINDIELLRSTGNLFVNGVDVSFRSILNRLGIPTWGFIFKYSTIPWSEIQFLGVDLPVKVKIDYDRLETLHPAEIARFIFQGPGYRKGSKIIQSLEEGVAADVLESLPLDVQVNIIEHMSAKASAKIISEMESHRATDILSELESAKASTILEFTPEKQAISLRDLLTYPAGTAGSMMKLEYMYFPQNITVDDLYQKIKEIHPLPDFLTYFYITESISSKKLVGVVSLWELFKSNSRDRLEKIMVSKPVVCKPYEKAKKVLKRITQYNFSAIPVVNKFGHLIGIITIHEAIRILLPRDWQTRVQSR